MVLDNGVRLGAAAEPGSELWQRHRPRLALGLLQWQFCDALAGGRRTLHAISALPGRVCGRMDTETMDTSGVASLSQDVLEVIGSYLETRDLVSSFALASRTLNDAADQCAAMRCRALFSSSAEIERRGVRLGATFLARRSRPLQMTQTPCSAREPHLIPARIPLASRPLQNMPEEEAVMSQDWPSDVSEDRDFDPYHENPTLEEALKKVQLASTTQTLPGLYFLIDVTVKTRDGIIVGRRSVMVDGAVPLSMDVVRFDEPLTIAEDLEPDFFYSEHFNSVEEDFACGWYMEFGNIVGCRNVVPCSTQSTK